MSSGGSAGGSRWLASEGVQRGESYDTRWEQLAADGASIHGEADLVASFSPTAVLDAGCGTGRVAIELAQRGIDVAGLDSDPAMLETARGKAPDIEWWLADLATFDVDRRFDLIVAAGNVMIFLEPGTEARVIARTAGHLAPGGRLVAGFQLGRGYELADYDGDAEAVGLTLVDRWSTWERAPWGPGADYAVSVHVRGA